MPKTTLKKMSIHLAFGCTIISPLTYLLTYLLRLSVVGMSDMNASELELIVLTKMELGRISLQRHHSWLAAEYQLSGMKLLQSSTLFSEDKRTINASTR